MVSRIHLIWSTHHSTIRTELCLQITSLCFLVAWTAIGTRTTKSVTDLTQASRICVKSRIFFSSLLPLFWFSGIGSEQMGFPWSTEMRLCLCKVSCED
ncbi:hypothetical protein GW17_00012909 [Ensete ventricosum]|nr:hypothetical protein GW17_00012909 [Ensete ventricosum]RZS13705.1 hypothetical protein BHM03_00045338 [Ensete ventricosum]